MKKINYDSHILESKAKALRLYTSSKSVDTNRRSHKPRDPEEDKILFLLDKLRWQKALETGRIEKLGPRRYRWND